jgi:hypothetical protein
MPATAPEEELMPDTKTPTIAPAIEAAEYILNPISRVADIRDQAELIAREILESDQRRCGTCRSRNADAECTNPKLREPKAGGFSTDPGNDELVYSYSEDGRFYVGELFGCVHYSKR